MASYLVDGSCPRCVAKLACPVGEIVMYRVHDIKQNTEDWMTTGQCKFCNELVYIGKLIPVQEPVYDEKQVDSDENIDSSFEGGYTDIA